MRPVQLLTAALLLICVASTNAASIFLTYTGNNDVAGDGAVIVASGDVLQFDIIMDFSGSGEAVLGGGFDINFDGALVRVTQFANVFQCGGDICDFFPEPQMLDGVLQSIFFASFSGVTGPALLGRISFEFVGANGSGDS